MSSGRVLFDPAVKYVTTTSSNESANARSPPATSAVESTGQVTNRKVCQPSAPRSADASRSDGDDRRKRARTLLYAITRQNVAWPITIVHSERSMCRYVKNEFSAIPVMIPGNAIG